ncbi:MAG: gamma-glutamyl-gamma-aminobutyrate hydrolase family protein [Thermoplasmatota archaeon]
MTSTRKKALILGGDRSYYKPFSFMYDFSFDLTDMYRHVDEYGLVVFTGGEDVTPHLYGDYSADNITHYSYGRDKWEQSAFNFALKNKVPMAGICRGMQFLNVMDGGRLLHDITGHAKSRGQHMMYTYRGVISVNSLHHQACIPSPRGLTIGWTKSDDLNVLGNYDVQLKRWPNIITEAMIFPSINAYGVQYHPEMMDNKEKAVQWFSELVSDFATFNSIEDIVNKWSYKRIYITDKKMTANQTQ